MDVLLSREVNSLETRPVAVGGEANRWKGRVCFLPQSCKEAAPLLSQTNYVRLTAFLFTFFFLFFFFCIRSKPRKRLEHKLSTALRGEKCGLQVLLSLRRRLESLSRPSQGFGSELQREVYKLNSHEMLYLFIFFVCLFYLDTARQLIWTQGACFCAFFLFACLFVLIPPPFPIKNN